MKKVKEKAEQTVPWHLARMISSGPEPPFGGGRPGNPSAARPLLRGSSYFHYKDTHFPRFGQARRAFFSLFQPLFFGKKAPRAPAAPFRAPRFKKV